MFNNRKGYSTGFAWIFGLVSLFGLGIMYIVFSQVFNANLVPIIKNMANNTIMYNGQPLDSGTVNAIYSGIDKYMSYFNALPFILFFVVVIFMIISAVRKERESEFE